MNKQENDYILPWVKKIKAINILGGVCKNCKCSDVRILEFHHIDSDEKEFNISNFRTIHWSKIEKEIQKCICLCPRCHFIYHFSNKIVVNNKRNINKKILLEYLNIDKCEECGWCENNCGLDFHHIDSDEKEFVISDEINIRLHTVEDLTSSIINEINKCKILCRNCHRLKHINIDKFSKLETEIYKRIETHKENKKTNHEQVISLYNSGYRPIEISKKLNIGKSLVSYILNKNNRV